MVRTRREAAHVRWDNMKEIVLVVVLVVGR